MLEPGPRWQGSASCWEEENLCLCAGRAGWLASISAGFRLDSLALDLARLRLDFASRFHFLGFGLDLVWLGLDSI